MAIWPLSSAPSRGTTRAPGTRNLVVQGLPQIGRSEGLCAGSSNTLALRPICLRSNFTGSIAWVVSMLLCTGRTQNTPRVSLLCWLSQLKVKPEPSDSWVSSIWLWHRLRLSALYTDTEGGQWEENMQLLLQQRPTTSINATVLATSSHSWKVNPKLVIVLICNNKLMQVSPDISLPLENLISTVAVLLSCNIELTTTRTNTLVEQ